MPDHGTRARYRGSRTVAPCRCQLCTQANTVFMRQYRDGGPAPVAKHGTRSKYNAGCRCDACATANRDFQREYQRAKRGYLWTEPRKYTRRQSNAVNEKDKT